MHRRLLLVPVLASVAIAGACVDFGPVSAGSAPDTSSDAGARPSEDAGVPVSRGDGGASSPSDASGAEAASGGGEAGSDDAGSETDGGPTFASPLQVSGISFNANTIVTTTAGGAPLTYIDGTLFTQDYNDFPTQSEATALSPGAMGLPDDAFFPNTGSTTIPPVQLGWNNADNVNNTIFVAADDDAGAPTIYAINIPPGHYRQVQIYATGAGATTLSYTLVYSTSGATSSSVTVPDWCFAPDAGAYVLASVDRVQNGTTLDPAICHIYAIDLSPDPQQTLTQVSFSDLGGANTYLALYGATAW